jgi:hypothetical protein
VSPIRPATGGQNAPASRHEDSPSAPCRSFPVLAKPGASIPTGPTMAALREALILKGWESTRIAYVLGVSKPRLANWCNGSDPAHLHPPMWAVLAMCYLAGAHLEIHPGQVKVILGDGNPVPKGQFPLLPG